MTPDGRDPGCGRSEHQGEPATEVGGQFGVGGKHLENRQHELPGLLADPASVSLDQVEAEFQRLGIPLFGREGLGQSIPVRGVVRVGVQGGAGLVQVAGLLGVVMNGQLGLEPLGLGFEEAATLQLRDQGAGIVQAPLGLERSGQTDGGHRLARGEFESFPELRLGGLGVGLQQAVRLGDPLLDLGGHQSVEKASEERLGLHADELVHDPTVAQAEDGRDAADPERAGDLGGLLGIHLRQQEATAVLLGEPLQQGAEQPARAAPGGPEIDDDRDLAGTLDDVPLEVRRVGLDQGRILGVHEDQSNPRTRPS